VKFAVGEKKEKKKKNGRKNYKKKKTQERGANGCRFPAGSRGAEATRWLAGDARILTVVKYLF
jgi:hypothetical protein